MTDTKRCSHCGQNKPTSAFYRSATRADGYDALCKECKKELLTRTVARKKLLGEPEELYRRRLYIRYQLGKAWRAHQREDNLGVAEHLMAAYDAAGEYVTAKRKGNSERKE